uniref:DUF3024 domain-containing protein n=1 Tax=Paenibacillus senegalensis TaxID=1465766 RepID=UPI000288C785|nr:DUF3024 domain-containing protein [Paenibacillus senegalensis]
MRSSVRIFYEWGDDQLTLWEERPDYHSRQWVRTGIAQFQLKNGKWSVLAYNGGRQWAGVKSISPHWDFERQLEQVELDHEGVFWIS